MSGGRDCGGVLAAVLVWGMLGAAVTYPLIDAVVAVRAHGAVAAETVRRTEALRSAGRMLLGDPRSLFRTCGASQQGAPAALAPFAAGTGSAEPVVVTTSCLEHSTVTAVDDGQILVTLTGVGAVLPAGIVDAAADRVVLHAEDHDPDSGAFPEEFWMWFPQADRPAPDTIWLPPLPVRPADAPAPMVGADGCTVWLPGSYPPVDDDGDGSVDPVVLTGEHYFASGVYYIGRPLVLGAGAQVVVGAGATPGCSTDAVARLRAGSAATAVSGSGAVIVLGGTGSIVVDTGITAGNDPGNGPSNDVPGTSDGAAPADSVSFVVEERITAPGDPNAALDGVALMEVSGTPDPAAVALPGLLAVSESRLTVVPPGAVPVTYHAAVGYEPVVGLPPCEPDPESGLCTGPLAAAPALVDLLAVGSADVRVDLHGALVVPQSRIALGAPAEGGSLAVTVRGALVAASLDVGGAPAATLPAGVTMTVGSGAGRAVQRTLRLESIVVGDGPNITSTIELQVNETGMYAISSWRIG